MHEMISIFQAPKEERENHIKHIKDRKETQPFQSAFSSYLLSLHSFFPINTGMSPNILSNQNLSNISYLFVVVLVKYILPQLLLLSAQKSN